MIVAGYPGIGKSTISKDNYKIVDLESSNFVIDDKRPYKWEQIYINVAEDLSRQGYTVFVSTHASVIHELERRNLEKESWICHPSINLKDEWITKLKDRYENTGLEKDRRAYENVALNYIDHITNFSSSTIAELEFNNMNYDLNALITYAELY